MRTCTVITIRDGEPYGITNRPEGDGSGSWPVLGDPYPAGMWTSGQSLIGGVFYLHETCFPNSTGPDALPRTVPGPLSDRREREYGLCPQGSLPHPGGLVPSRSPSRREGLDTVGADLDGERDPSGDGWNSLGKDGSAPLWPPTWGGPLCEPGHPHGPGAA